MCFQHGTAESGAQDSLSSGMDDDRITGTPLSTHITMLRKSMKNQILLASEEALQNLPSMNYHLEKQQSSKMSFAECPSFSIGQRKKSAKRKMTRDFFNPVKP
ncbi:MAG: hypothetical protein ACK53K_08450 [Burkholderiales bacterium]|jgi:hypothetical protein